MEGSNLQKIARLVEHLCKSPEDILPYVVDSSVFLKKSPLSLKLPWFSWGAIRFLDIYICPGMKVFEWGSGGSSLFFGVRQCKVFSVEDNVNWYQKVVDEIKQCCLSDINIMLSPYDFYKVKNFEESAYFNPEFNLNTADVIVIDGAEEEIKVRPKCFEKAQREICSGLIVVDDSWRYPEIIKMSTARKIHRFQGTGPCRPGVTSTDIHFY